MKKQVLLFSLLFFSLLVKAQERWTLQKAVDYALANNLTIRQRELQILNNQASLNQTKWQRYPTLSTNSNFGWNTGRSIDRFTNQFVTQTYNFNSWGVNANVPIFTGFQILNNIEQNKQLVEATKQDKEQARQEVALNTVLAYLNVVNNEELVEVAKLQVETSRQQLERTKKLVDAGSLPINNLYDLQSQLATDELTLVTNQNNVNLAKINLMQTMNLPLTENFQVERIAVPDPSTDPYPQNSAQVYEIALQSQPAIKAAKHRITGSQYSVKAARGSLLPTISGFLGISTNYVSTAPAQLFQGDGTSSLQQKTVGYFINSDGSKQPVFADVQVSNGTYKDNTYFDQLSFNRSTNYGLSLQIPILNGYQARTQISRNLIQQRQNEYSLEQAKITLRQNIEQAYVNMVAAAQRYRANTEAVNAQQQAFNATKARFEAGLLNSVDFSLSQTRLGTAKANLVQAKYDYVFRAKILDFYQNKPLTF
jgi:outer membrane protein